MILFLARAHAGMPMVSLTDLATQRLQVLSFFLLILVVSAVVIGQLWNRLTPWPRLSFRRALGLTVLWGLLFHLVLTMISGARELMTPGAWEKDGATYVLGAEAELREQLLAVRQARLERLRDDLWLYAQDHDGAFPDDEFDPTLPPGMFDTTHTTGARFVYLPAARADVGAEVVAYEPGVFGEARWVLRSSGAIALQPIGEILE